MPAASANGHTAETAFVGMVSLPISIPWIDGATATYDLIRVLDVSARYDALLIPYLDEAARIVATREAFTAETSAEERAALDARGDANNEAAQLFLLEYTRCQLDGINPTPIPGRAETWAHIHPALRTWLAQHGRVAAEAQLASPLARLMGPASLRR